MGDKTGIEWTDATWNPTTGCDQVSPGCDHCYALTLAKRLKAMGTEKYQNDGDPRTSGPGFGFTMHGDDRTLLQPLRWTRPRRIFVNSMSDLFHGGMAVEFLAKVYAVMSLAPRHTFQVLTKRPQIARTVMTKPVTVSGATMPFKMLVDVERMRMGHPVLPDSADADGNYAWPLRNVILGTSVEDQKRADLRIDHLLATPAAARFLSMEPLLGRVTLAPWMTGSVPLSVHLDWIIVGGESGKRVRMMHPDWVRGIRDQADHAGIPFLFKQWGNWRPLRDDEEPYHTDRWLTGGGLKHDEPWNPDQRPAPLGKWSDLPDVLMRPGDKRDNGRTLDGRTYDAFPVMADA